MKTITFYLDFISPYAYLAFEALPRSLQAVSHRVVYKPVLFAAMLKHHGQLGPAEIAGKREWTYRQVLWLAQKLGVPLDLPQAHPFNPLSLLRLALACSHAGETPHAVVETVFHHVWRGGGVADDAARGLALAAHLAPPMGPDAPEVKQQLKANTDEAIARGVFGVPSLCVDDKVFWGLDALPMLQAYLAGDPWFDQAWDAAAAMAPGVRR